MAARIDPCSLSNPEDFLCKHISWQIEVDFPAKLLRCSAKLKVECVRAGAEMLILDTKGLIIHDVCLAESERELQYTIENELEPFGKPLEIKIPQEYSQKSGLLFNIVVNYETTSESSAIDWLEPEQTSGKKHPFLFTQCQAIHARSIIPCQDTPAVKFTYDAEVKVPSELVALMSAIKDSDEVIIDDSRKCKFHQKTAIPSYLLALVAGSLEGRDIGPRSRVWAEKDVIAKAAYEFSEPAKAVFAQANTQRFLLTYTSVCVSLLGLTFLYLRAQEDLPGLTLQLESMLTAAENLCGPYVWERYDLLVLPPSFPYGGMENPCLTFVTPTLLAGDRSLTGVAAHEIAHSWTGNLVTNRTWEHFWLNEGFTRFVESKVIGKLRGESMRQLQAIGGWKALIDSIEKFGATNPLTALVTDLKGIDPDDAFSAVPYEKGFALLYYLEYLAGGPVIFDEFLRSYIDTFKYQTITTEDFKSYLFKFFKSKGKDGLFSQVDWDSWFNNPGMPPVDVSKLYDTSAIDECNKLAERWLKEKTFESFSSCDLQDFSSSQIIEFLSKLLLEESIEKTTLKIMDLKYNLRSMENNEIKFRWLRLCIRAEHEEMYPLAVQFITQQGRMKYIRPLYSEMYKKEMSRSLAIKTFQENGSRYHTIATTMVAKDLNL